MKFKYSVSGQLAEPIEFGSIKHAPILKTTPATKLLRECLILTREVFVIFLLVLKLIRGEVRLLMAKQAGWKQNQQKQTGSTDQESREALKGKVGMVTVKMRTAYRDIAKAGDIVEFDAEKAEELVRLNRAEYIKGKGGDTKMDENKNVVDATEEVVAEDVVVATDEAGTTEVTAEGAEAPTEDKVEEGA